MFSVFRKDRADYSDRSQYEPVLRCSICTGEQTAGFRDIRTGKFTDIALIRTAEDLAEFRRKYRINGEIRKIY